MASSPVRPDQFNITPQGITHKPTDAGFTPYPGNPLSGITRVGYLGRQYSVQDFELDDVKKVMQTLWREYVAQNPALFK